MNPSSGYPAYPASSALFGTTPSGSSASGSSSTPSASMSDGASPYTMGNNNHRSSLEGSQQQSFPPYLFGVDQGVTPMSTFLPAYQPDGVTSSSFFGYPDMHGFNDHLGPGTAHALQNMSVPQIPGTNYDPRKFYSRSTLAGPSRYPSADTISLSVPAPSRPPVPSYSSPSHPIAPLPQSHPPPWVPQDRGPWQEPTPPDVLDFSALTGGSAAFSSRIKSPDQAQPGSLAGERRQAVMGLAAGMRDSSLVPRGDEGSFSQDFSLGLSTGGVQDYPRSAAYPDNLYGSLPDGLVGPDFGVATANQGSASDTGRALEIYEHVLATLPHIRPTRDPPPNPSPLQPLLDLSFEAQSIISKLHPPPLNADGMMHGSTMSTPRRHSTAAQPGAGAGPTAKRAKEKGTTKCTGCGATETPEWRRGPLGPRTLCNACGLVHMKIQKKKEKQEEKAAARAALAQAKTGPGGGHKEGIDPAGGGGRIKRVKREETA